MVTMFIVLLLGVCVSICNACSCVGPQGQQKYCGYPIVFRGKVKGVTFEGDVDPYNFREMDMATVINTVWVKEAFVMPDSLKANSTISLRTRVTDNMCGVNLPFIDDMVFAANIYEDKLHTSSCAPISEWASLSSSAKQFLANINKQSCP